MQFVARSISLCIFLLITISCAYAQYRNESQLLVSNMVDDYEKTGVEYLASADLQYHQKFRSPQMIDAFPVQETKSWTSAITTQSYGKGKVGTFYYWDINGNLSGTQGFIDIAGKNKRGLKLVFPWRQLYNNR